MRFETGNNTLFLPDGGRYIFAARVYTEQSATQFIDRHGNTLSYNSATRQWTDTLGRVIGVPFPAAPTAGYTPYILPGVNGSTITYNLRWQNLTDVRSDPSQALRYAGDRNWNEPPQTLAPSLFASSGNNRVCASAIFNPVVLSEIILPNGQSYRFTYNIWGEIDKVYLPTGGYERYRYAQVEPAGIVTGIYKQTNRGVVERWSSVNGTGSDEARWQYSTATPVGASYRVTTIAPDLTYGERLIQRGSGSFTIDYGFDSALVGTAYDERAFSSGGQMLRRTLTEYTVSGPTPGGESTATRDPRVTKQVSIVLDTGGNALAATTTMQYDADLNTISTSSYEYASVDQTTAQSAAIAAIPQGALVRTQEATYLVNDATIYAGTKAAYRARNLVGLPTSSRIKNAAGTIVGQSRVSYDEAGYPLLTYGAVTGWSDPGANVRGNATTLGSWLNTTGTYLETHAQYDQCGSLRNSWDARGNQSQVEYSSSYAYAYPTLLRTPIPDPSGQNGSATALVSTSVYDFNTGLVTSTTDANNQSTSFAYNDSLNRPTLVTRPPGGGSTIYEYGDTAGSSFVKTRTAQDVTRYVETYQYLDGLGRASRSFLNESGTYATSDTQYDNMGRVWRVANPYRTTSLTDLVNPSGLWTTNGYDALGRVLMVVTPTAL